MKKIILLAFLILFTSLQAQTPARHTNGAVYGGHATAPTSPTPKDGQIYYNSGDKIYYRYNGTEWTSFNIFKFNLNASVAPTVDNDSSEGYSVASRWFDTTAKIEYVLLDSSAGSAVWEKTTKIDAADVVLDDTDLVVVPVTELQAFADGVDSALLKARGTGVTSTYVSTVSVGGTTFAQPAVKGEIHSDQGYFNINYAGATGVTVSDLTVSSTYIYIDNTGALAQQTTTPTRQDWSRKIFTMRIGVNTVTETIINFEYLNNPIGHYANSIRDLYQYLLLQGVPFKADQIITGRNSDLGFDVSAGTLMEFGGTGDIDNANIRSYDAVDNTSYNLMSRTDLVSSETDLVKFWDNAGTITALGSTTLVGHRLYRFSSGNFAMQYGQGNYANMALAKLGVTAEEYVLNPALKDATFFGWWFIESTATNTGGNTLTDFVEYTIGVQGGSSSFLSGALLKSNNLADIASAPTSRINLGLNTTANQTDSTDKRFISDAEQVVLDNFTASDTFTGDLAITGDVTAVNGLLSGAVGIGVTNMSSFFNQANQMVIGGSGNHGMTIYSSSSGNNVIAFADVADGANSGFNEGGTLLYAHSDNSMQFRTNGTQALSLNSDQTAAFASDVDITGDVTAVNYKATAALYGIETNGLYAPVGNELNIFTDNNNKDINITPHGTGKLVVSGDVTAEDGDFSGALDVTGTTTTETLNTTELQLGGTDIAPNEFIRDNSYYSFDGTSGSYARVTDTDINEFGEEDFTVSWRAKWITPDIGSMISKYDTADPGFDFNIASSSTWYFGIRGTGGGQVSAPVGITPTSLNNQWVFFTVRRINGVINCFINNNKGADFSSSTDISNSIDLSIAWRSSYFSKIDVKEVKLDNYGLTDSQVKDRYNGLPIPSEYVGADNVELVTNGDFATDTDWSKGTNWTISGGVASCDGTSLNALYQSLTVPLIGKTYQLKYNISNYTAGNIRFYYGGVFTSFVSSNGEYSVIINAISTDNALQTSMSSAFNGSIDNVSVTLVGNTLNLQSGKQDANWIDSDHDISATVTGATLNNLQGVSGTNGFFANDLKVLGDVNITGDVTAVDGDFSGFVGVGTTSSNISVDVRGNSSIGDGIQSGANQHDSGNRGYTRFGRFPQSEFNGFHSEVRDLGGGNNGGFVSFYTWGGNIASTREVGRFTETGNFGVNTTTASEKIEVNGNIKAINGIFSGDVTLVDNGKALFGTGGDLEIYHNGTNSIIEPAIENSEDLYIGGTKAFTTINYNAFDHIFAIDGTVRFGIADDKVSVSTDLGVGSTTGTAKLNVGGGIKMADDAATASLSKVGTLRYRTSGNNSYLDICMQTLSNTYVWVNIKTNSW
jgi:hypothetical protein